MQTDQRDMTEDEEIEFSLMNQEEQEEYLRVHMVTASEDARTYASKSTIQTYAHSKKKWKQFCRKKRFNDGAIVNVEKMVAFYHEVLVVEGNTRSKDGYKPLARETVASHFKAITDLYTDQANAKLNL